MPSSSIASDDPFISRISDLLHRLTNLLDRNRNPRQVVRSNFHTFVKRDNLIISRLLLTIILLTNKIKIMEQIRFGLEIQQFKLFRVSACTGIEISNIER